MCVAQRIEVVLHNRLSTNEMQRQFRTNFFFLNTLFEPKQTKTYDTRDGAK